MEADDVQGDFVEHAGGGNVGGGGRPLHHERA